MKKQFVVLALEESPVILSARLSSTGVDTEEAYHVVSTHVGTRDTEEEAMQLIKQADLTPEHGFEIRVTYAVN